MSKLTFLARKIEFRGHIEEVPEDLIVMVENMVKSTGEPLNEAIERLVIENREVQRLPTTPPQIYKPDTLDYYLPY